MQSFSRIRSAAILGAGTMGAQIAAHMANAGLEVTLLDLTADAARRGLEKTRRLKPDPFFTPEACERITTGGFDVDLSRLADSDWVLEAVVEDFDVKRALLERVDACRRPDAIASSNTSGLPVAALAAGRSPGFRRHWLGTHFFNPPRYLRLLEIIPTPDTDRSVVELVSAFADTRLGKGVVVAKDAPNFIANRIGLFGVARILEALESGDWTIEEIDAVTGPVLGRPKSATFRTLDIAGLDVLAHVARNLGDRLPSGESRLFQLPPLIQALIDRGWTGEKAGQGFYRRQAGHNGAEILVLDPATWMYRTPRPVRLASLDGARSIGAIEERVRALFLGRDEVGAFLRKTLGPTLLYAAKVWPEVAHSPDDVDRAMRWGFGWELGPFEMWDAIGVHEVMEAVGGDPPAMVANLLGSGRNRFREGRLAPASVDFQLLKSARERNRTVRRNAEASLVDLGDGVLGVEFHSKMNTIGAGALEMLQLGVREAAAGFLALLVVNEAPNFSAGANLALLLAAAQQRHWDEIDRMVRAFQGATQALRCSAVPVIACPAGLALGGGCEVTLYAHRAQAAAESYIGLVETSVGLIPAAGGTTEMLARAMEGLPEPGADLLPFVRRVFETIGFARVSTSAPEARRLGYLRPVDGVTMNRDRLTSDAKSAALECVREGYSPPLPRKAIPVGGDGLLAALKLGVHLAWRAGRLSDHDALIGRTLAWVLAGGSLPNRTTLSEHQLLDLEREAFLKLCGEPRTIERIQHTLRTGKPLRN